MRGKPWRVEEERRLRGLISEGLGIEEISKVMGKTRVSVRAKMYHLGLVLVDATTAAAPLVASVASLASVASTPNPTTSKDPVKSSSPSPLKDLALPAGSQPEAGSRNVDLFSVQLKKDGPLPSIEEKLRVLNAALVALEKPDLRITEVARLNKIIQGVKVYQELFAHFVNYQALENEVVELKKQLASGRTPK